ncbi:MAG TPA: aryl-sulfate sulfotransferase [Gemmatimonadales bacterium]|nr:aryl-sulfate sulfotransferase [Gemmatimonadales bacterium]
MRFSIKLGNKAVLLLWSIAGMASGCRSDAPVEARETIPRLVSAAVLPNPHNVLSAVVTFTAEHAESARVVYQDERLALDSTPFFELTGLTDTVVILGLRPAAGYKLVVEVDNAEGGISSDTLQHTAGALPEALGRVSIAASGIGSGLSLTSVAVPGAGVFALAFDSSGVIRWYRHFQGEERFPGELKRQANGNFTLYRGSSTGVEKVPGHYVEFTPAGDSVRALTVTPPRYLDNHDLWITTGPDGQERFHFFTYDHRIADLRPIGGGAEVSLAGHQLVRLRSDGSTEFEWNAWDHLEIEEWIEPPHPTADAATVRDFDHPNSLTFDLDGHYIVSFRQLGQIMKIDAMTGEIIWRLGGLRSDFTFSNDPLGGFSAQHSPGILPNGNLLLYDNGARHQPPESRAVEYALDVVNRTATLVWEFRHTPPIYTLAVGSAQRLQDGNTLIGYGWVGYAAEVGADQNVKWSVTLSVDGQATVFYRMIRIPSLYGLRTP